jgi:macrolide transport system ATP-binding/permease protein
MVFSATSLAGAFAVSSTIGIVFGFAPARNAARLDPVRALARE